MIAFIVAIAVAATPVAHRKVVTEDGASLALYRYGVGDKPVLFIVDFGFTRQLAEPFAQYLAERGRLVYVAELRGQGASSAGMSLRSVVHLDFAAIQKAIGARVDLVAHGYAGSLALAAAGHELDVRKVVAFSTPMIPEQPTELQEWFLSNGTPYSSLNAEVFDQLFSMQSKANALQMSELRRTGTRALSHAMATELLAWMKTGDLPLDDGTTVLRRLRGYERPTLMFLGLANAWAPSEACVILREFAPGDIKLRSFSRFSNDDDFAHVTLLMGSLAPSLVFPDAEEFLR
ncbi:MAG: alpha/beta fold hydrolase [Archangium sp.]